MSVAVAAITFDHLRGQPGAYTVPLRLDALHAVPLPEWRHGQVLPSVAAYAIDRLRPSASVRVRFAASPDEPRVLALRARVEPMPGAFPPPLALLGDLPARTVGFDASGSSGWLTFAFDTAALSVGVDAATLRWRWQCRRGPADAWSDVALTVHKVYALLSVPTGPWQADPPDASNPGLPRTDVLDFACLWARGARDPGEASARITEAVNRLGETTLRYDALVGAPNYTVLGFPSFLCDAFLDRLRGGLGMGPLVNCSDCATIVSTIANALGADLWQSKMGLVGPGFRLNPLLAIGTSTWSTLFGSFGFHEVAWTDDCNEDDLVFDACVQLDRDADPTRAPYAPELPAGVRFGRPGDNAYRDRIAAPGDRDECAPQPGLRIRRPLAPALAPAPPWPVGLRATSMRRVGIDQAPAPADVVAFEGFRWFGGELSGWSLSSSTTIETAARTRARAARAEAGGTALAGERVVVALWRSTRCAGALLRVESIEAENGESARDLLVRSATEVENPGLQPWARGIEGESALALTDGTLAMFTRGNHLHVVRSAGLEPYDVRGDAEAIDRWLMGAGDPVRARAGVPVPPVVAHWTRRQRAPGAAAAGVRAAGGWQPPIAVTRLDVPGPRRAGS